MVKNIVWPAKQGRLKVDYTTCADSHQMLSERSICHRVKTKSTSNQFRLESCFVGLFKKWEIHQHIHHILCKGEWSALRFWRRHNRWRKSRPRVNFVEPGSADPREKPKKSHPVTRTSPTKMLDPWIANKIQQNPVTSVTSYPNFRVHEVNFFFFKPGPFFVPPPK